MIVSQRPSEISETILSQCNNYVVMRLVNPTDVQYIKRLVLNRLPDWTALFRFCGRRGIIMVMPFSYRSVFRWTCPTRHRKASTSGSSINGASRASEQMLKRLWTGGGIREGHE